MNNLVISDSPTELEYLFFQSLLNAELKDIENEYEA